MMIEGKREVRRLFMAALELDTPAERARYLDEACGDKPELHQRIEILLKAHDRAGGFLEQTVALPPSSDFEVERTGVIIGRYKLLEQIGEGGCGVVYMAGQAEPVHRKVALKIIKAGMDTKEVVARFEAERQALALMDHPNIAKVFDGGVTQAGRPYFVMELVKGVPITDYCDRHHLPMAERLQLFIQACHAVQHAHQKGIIHRDLKPSNILITMIDGKPVPKIIDFGVAKALGQQLTERTLFTAFQQIVGTPLYMSPEQTAISGMDVDTRSDIYSLGVLLYELLTGSTPIGAEMLRKAGLDEVRRMIRETDPPVPSTRLRTLGDKLSQVAQHRHVEPSGLTRQVHGDLDWIVMKALEKDRARRYETVNALLMDLQRHLEHQPVMAGPPTLSYRLAKFARRNRQPLLTGAGILLAIMAVAGYLVWEGDVSRKQAIKVASKLNNDLAFAQDCVAHGQWREAGRCYAGVLESPAFDLSALQQNDGWLSLKMSGSLLYAGETNAYQALREKLCDELSQSKSVTEVQFLALFLGPTPGSHECQMNLLPLARGWHDGLSNRTELHDITRGLAEYRHGNWTDADWFLMLGTQKDEVEDQAIPLAVAAMSAWHRGDTRRAWQLLGLARVIPEITTNVPPNFELSPLVTEVVTREAAETIGTIPSGINDELLEIVDLLRRADRLGRAGQWELAAEDYRQALLRESFDLQTFKPMETCLGLKMAATFLSGSDTESYMRLCDELEHIPLHTLRSLFIERQATIMLMDGNLQDPSRRQAAIASMQNRRPPKTGGFLYYWWYNAQAVAEFWNRDYQACLESCRIAKTSKESKCRVRGWAIEAMAMAMTGDQQGAADAIGVAEAMLRDEEAQAAGDYRWNWHDVPIARILTRQARALLNDAPQTPGSSEGT